ADLVVLSKDYFSVAEEEIKGIESVLTVVDGKVVYAAGHFSPLAPPPIADLVVLSKDYFSVAEEEIKGIESVLTVVDGKV
ncbi:hypothetical protein CKQ90_34340, partial [Klebsiella pneumoniae]